MLRLSFQIVSASQAGNIQFLDMRNTNNTYLTIDAHRGSLTALAIHRHAPIIASGSAKQLIKVFNLEGDPLGTIRYYPTFMAQKIGSVSCLTFHPYQVLLAAGAADACVSIYADEISPPRWTHSLLNHLPGWKIDSMGFCLWRYRWDRPWRCIIYWLSLLIRVIFGKRRINSFYGGFWQIIFVVYRSRKM